MKRQPVFAACAALVMLGCADRPGPIGPATDNTADFESATILYHENFRGAFSFVTFSCSGEPIAVEGYQHVQYRASFDDAGGYHYQFHYNLQGVGIGLESDTRYVLVQGGLYANNQPGPPQTYELTNSFMTQLISEGSSPNQAVHGVFHMTLDANGRLTSLLVKFTFECRGSAETGGSATTIVPSVSAAAWERLEPDGSQGRAATGSGQFVIGGQLRTFAFAAIQHADGRVSGESQLVRRFATVEDARVHSEVTCLQIDGPHAWIGGVVKRTSLPEFMDTETSFEVQDNGEGTGAPDMISLQNVGGEPGYAENYCRMMERDPSQFPIEHGNVQVRP